MKISVALLTLLTLFSLNTFAQVDIPDANLRAAVLAALEKPTDAQLTPADMENLTVLGAGGAGISDLTGLEHATNLTGLWLFDNQLSDISALAGLTNLTGLYLSLNQISDISTLAGLTNLTSLDLRDNQISDISELAGLTNLTGLWLNHNQVSDISALLGLTNLTRLLLEVNPLSYASIYTHIPTLQDNGVAVQFTNRTPRGLAIESGDNQNGAISTPLAQAFVVKVMDEHNNPFEGVPVTFTVTQGGGTLSATSTTTDADGLAESTLTLGSSAGTNTVEVSASNIQQRVVFNAEGSVTGPPAQVDIPDAKLRAAVLDALDKPTDAQLTLADMENLTVLRATRKGISDLTGLEHATNLTQLYLSNNPLSDISVLAGLTNLTQLYLSFNQISDIAALAGLTNLTTLWLAGNPLSDISVLAGLTNLTQLGLNDNPLSDISVLAGLTNLTRLYLSGNQISDISALAGLTNLTILDLARNQILDISVLVGLAKLETLQLLVNPLSYASIYTHIPTLQDNGVDVRFTNRTPTGLAIDSGNNQNGEISTPLAQPLVVKVTDENDAAFEGVPVTFTVTQGGGTLSTTSATTDADGLAESTLTLGSSAGTNTVEVSASKIQQRVVFNAEGSVTDAPAQVNIPDANLRAAVLDAVGKPTDAQLTLADMENLTVLRAQSADISDLTGLEHATNLTTLWLDGNQISDISALSGLTNLTDLTLGWNPLSDISALAGLTNLTKLLLRDNPLSDISALAGLTNLTNLGLDYNQISDISALSGLTNLTGLSLNRNPLLDISALSGLTNLTSLWLGYNSLSDLSALSGLTNLTELGLRNNQISDLSVLSGLTNLTILWLGYNSLSDISVLSGLTNLTRLELSANQLSDISVLSGLTNLTDLDLGGNPLSDISALSGLTNLTRLVLRGNPLSYPSIYTHIPTLQDNGVEVGFTIRTPTGLAIDSGNNQTGEVSTPLAQPFVVKVTDENDEAFEGVPVTFTVTKGDGTLSATSTTTDADGLAESTLTLGSSAGTNTVEVTASNIQQRVVFNAEGTRKRIVGDVNQDGVVNIFDLVLVANRFGQTGEDGADVNEDGLVNILDLVLVAGAFGDTGSAAPPKHPQALELLTATDVKQWLIQARGLGLTDATSQKGLIFLEQLLAVLTPSQTTLLPNYPNPFNPETWIPYRLAKDAFVTLTIYDQRGRMVRQVDVGYRTAAVYERRDKAIYWDGRNAVGEAVASGVYFYTLTTGDFTATRKMLILK